MGEDEGRGAGRDDDRGDDEGEGLDAPLGRGALDEILRPRCPLEVTPLLLASARDRDVLPGVPLS
jgi:hypothetical protein